MTLTCSDIQGIVAHTGNRVEPAAGDDNRQQGQSIGAWRR